MFFEVAYPVFAFLPLLVPLAVSLITKKSWLGLAVYSGILTMCFLYFVVMALQGEFSPDEEGAIFLSFGAGLVYFAVCLAWTLTWCLYKEDKRQSEAENDQE